MQRSSQRVCIDGGIGIDLRIFRATCRLLFHQPVREPTQRCHMHAVVRQFHIPYRSLRCFHAFHTIKHPRHQQTIFNGVQTLGALRMPRSHFMPPARTVRKIACLPHVSCPLFF